MSQGTGVPPIKMKIEHLFSSPLYVNTLSKEDEKQVKKLIPVLEDDFDDANDKNKNADHWNCLSYQTYLHGNGQDELTESLYKYIDEFLINLGFTGFKYEVNGWFNIYQQNQFQEAHNHLPELLSGMVVMQYDKEKHRPTEFVNFHTQEQCLNTRHYVEMGYLKVPANFNISNEYIPLGQMEDNKIFIWNAAQQHRVPPQPKADKLRITYTFNVRPVYPT